MRARDKAKDKTDKIVFTRITDLISKKALAQLDAQLHAVMIITPWPRCSIVGVHAPIGATRFFGSPASKWQKTSVMLSIT